jgi:hypothetical protein
MFSTLPDGETLVLKLADDTADDSRVLTPDHNLRNIFADALRAIQLDASTQTDSKDASSSNETLTSVALDFISSNFPAVLIASSMLHQAAKTVQCCIRRFVGSSDTARQRAVATTQQQEDALFRTHLSRLRAIELMCMNSRDVIYDFADGTILLLDEQILAQVDAYLGTSRFRLRSPMTP